MKLAQLPLMLLTLLITANSILVLPAVHAQTRFDRTFQWTPNAYLNCPGNIACDQGGAGTLMSPDYTIQTGFTHFMIQELDAICSVRNMGPQTAAFDVGVIFGSSESYLGGPGRRPYVVNGIYRGSAFGWIGLGVFEPDWSIDFTIGTTKAGGADIYNED